MRGSLREKVHVVETGDSTAQHFRASQQRSVVNELWRRVFCLGWPDVMLQPIHQRQIVGQTSEKRHCSMGVQVDQAWDEDVVGEPFCFLRDKLNLGVRVLQNCNNSSLFNGNRVIFEYGFGRFDRNYPLCFDKEVNGGWHRRRCRRGFR